MRKFVSLALVLVMLITTMAVVPFTASATTSTKGYYNTYDTITVIPNKSDCIIMQGFAVGSKWLYCVKTNREDTKAFISKTNKNTGETIYLKNTSNNSYYMNYLGHANDMCVATVDGYSNLYVATMKKNSHGLVRLKVDGSKITKMGNFTLKYNGKVVSMSGVSIMSKTSTKLNFLFKSGKTLYTGSLSMSAKSGVINLTKAFTLDTSSVKIDGKTVNVSSYTPQGLGYYDGDIYVPLWNSAKPGQSVIVVYPNITKATGTVKSSSTLSFRITSGTYSKQHEIESCGISSSDGKMYFNTIRGKTSTGEYTTGVHCFNKFATKTNK